MPAPPRSGGRLQELHFLRRGRCPPQLALEGALRRMHDWLDGRSLMTPLLPNTWLPDSRRAIPRPWPARSWPPSGSTRSSGTRRLRLGQPPHGCWPGSGPKDGPGAGGRWWVSGGSRQTPRPRPRSSRCRPPADGSPPRCPGTARHTRRGRQAPLQGVETPVCTRLLGITAPSSGGPRKDSRRWRKPPGERGGIRKGF